MEELRSWQALVSLWDRMKDRRLHMHEAPSTFEIDRPAREGWLMRRSKSAGVFAEWRRQWAVLKRAHLFLYDRPDSSRPSNWYLLRKVRWCPQNPGVGLCVHPCVSACPLACACGPANGLRYVQTNTRATEPFSHIPRTVALTHKQTHASTPTCTSTQTHTGGRARAGADLGTAARPGAPAPASPKGRARCRLGRQRTGLEGGTNYRVYVLYMSYINPNLLYVCMHVCMYVCIVCVHACVCVYMRVCVCVCVTYV